MRYLFAKSLIVNQIRLFRLFQRIRLLDFSALVCTHGKVQLSANAQPFLKGRRFCFSFYIVFAAIMLRRGQIDCFKQIRFWEDLQEMFVCPTLVNCVAIQLQSFSRNRPSQFGFCQLERMNC